MFSFAAIFTDRLIRNKKLKSRTVRVWLERAEHMNVTSRRPPARSHRPNTASWQMLADELEGASSDSDDLEALLAAAGFVVTPTEIPPDPRLDVEELHRQLLLLSQQQHLSPAEVPADSERGTWGPPNVEAMWPWARKQWSGPACYARALCNSPFDEHCLLRSYGPGPCAVLVIAFGSLTKGAYGSREAGEAVFEFVGTCRRVGVQHALFVRDPLQSWFMRFQDCDTSSEQPSAYTAIVALLAREIEALKPERVVCLGESMGGHAAVQCGLALGASSVVALAPQVFTSSETRTSLELEHMVFEAELKRLTHAAARLGGTMPSLIDAARDATSGRTQRRTGAAATTHIEVHVGDRSRGDVWEAMLLQAAVEADTGAAPAAAATTSGCYADGVAPTVPSPLAHHGGVTMPVSVCVQVNSAMGHCIGAGLKRKGKLDDILRAHLGSSAYEVS